MVQIEIMKNTFLKDYIQKIKKQPVAKVAHELGISRQWLYILMNNPNVTPGKKLAESIEKWSEGQIRKESLLWP